MSKRTTKTTPVGKVVYPHLFEAHAMKDTDTPKFSVRLIFSASTDLSELEKLVDEIADKTWPDGRPKKFRSPFRTGDEMEQDFYKADDVFVTFRRNGDFGAPPVAGPDGKVLTDKTVYSGCLGRVAYSAYAVKDPSNPGVSLSLEAFQKCADGEPIGFAPIDLEETFDPVEDDALADLLG